MRRRPISLDQDRAHAFLRQVTSGRTENRRFFPLVRRRTTSEKALQKHDERQTRMSFFEFTVQVRNATEGDLHIGRCNTGPGMRTVTPFCNSRAAHDPCTSIRGLDTPDRLPGM